MKLCRYSELVINEWVLTGKVNTVFVVIESKYGILLQFNRYRRVWELPGGIIEEGETARTCAIRECMEECAQDVSDALFVGSVQLLYEKNQYQPNDEFRETPIFYKFINDIALFTPNEEIKAITWCHKLDAPPKPYCTASINIARAIVDSLHQHEEGNYDMFL